MQVALMAPRTPARLSWSALLALDMSLAATIVAVSSALCLGQMAVIVDKARFTEVLLHLSTARNAGAERIALTGELVALDTGATTVENGYRFQYRQAGTSVVASGVLRESGPMFQLALNPSISEADLGWSVIWLCGLRRAPPGWVALAPPLVERLSTEQLPFVCRDTRVE